MIKSSCKCHKNENFEPGSTEDGKPQCDPTDEENQMQPGEKEKQLWKDDNDQETKGQSLDDLQNNGQSSLSGIEMPPKMLKRDRPNKWKKGPSAAIPKSI